MSELRILRVLSCMLALSFGIAMSSSVVAKLPDQGHGRVSMLGSIIDTPCAIATDDIDQTVDMGVTRTDEIRRTGVGEKHPFAVELVNCDLHSHLPNKPDKSYFSVMFDGVSKDGIFSVNGADGVGLEIADDEGNVAIPGKSLPERALSQGNQTLNYTLQLVENHEHLSGGEYHTSIRFKVDYF